MQVLYRPAKAVDAPFIVESQVAMALETEEMRLEYETVAEGVERVFVEPELGRYYISECDAKPVGCLLILKEWSDWRNAFVWWIHSLYIQPSFRRKKLFTEFYRYLQKTVTTREDACGLRLYVDKRNTHARSVYKKLGMNADHYEMFEWMKDQSASKKK